MVTGGVEAGGEAKSEPTRYDGQPCYDWATTDIVACAILFDPSVPVAEMVKVILSLAFPPDVSHDTTVPRYCTFVAMPASTVVTVQDATVSPLTNLFLKSTYSSAAAGIGRVGGIQGDVDRCRRGESLASQQPVNKFVLKIIRFLIP